MRVEPSPEQRSEVKTELRECAFCKEALRIVEIGGHRQAMEVASGSQHVCWENLPQDANLLVIDD